MKRFWVLLILVVVVVSAAGCGTSGSSTPAPTTVPTQAAVGSTYPYPAVSETETVPVVVDSSYPAPQAAATAIPDPYIVDGPLEIPAPAEGKAVVKGIALTPGEGGKPYLGSIYLAPTVSSDDPTAPPLIGFSPETDQRGIQDKDGNIVFTNVEPGKYALVIYSLGGTVIIADPASGDTLLFDVAANETKDMGVIPVP